MTSLDKILGAEGAKEYRESVAELNRLLDLNEKKTVEARKGNLHAKKLRYFRYSQPARNGPLQRQTRTIGDCITAARRQLESGDGWEESDWKRMGDWVPTKEAKRLIALFVEDAAEDAAEMRKIEERHRHLARLHELHAEVSRERRCRTHFNFLDFGVERAPDTLVKEIDWLDREGRIQSLALNRYHIRRYQDRQHYGDWVLPNKCNLQHHQYSNNVTTSGWGVLTSMPEWELSCV